MPNARKRRIITQQPLERQVGMDWKDEDRKEADWKELAASAEAWTGIGLISVGVALRGLGVHDLFAAALPPFGIGLILSEVAVKLAKAARDKAKVRVKKRGDS